MRIQRCVITCSNRVACSNRVLIELHVECVIELHVECVILIIIVIRVIIFDSIQFLFKKKKTSVFA